MSKKESRRSVEVVNPRPGSPSYIGMARALQHCATGAAYLTGDGTLRFKEIRRATRCDSDVYITGQVNWRGSADIHTLHRPGEVRS